MIIKSFEINKINFKKINFFLLYGENEGFKNEAIESQDQTTDKVKNENI